MSGETYIPRKLKVCMYVWGNIHTYKLEVCMYVKGMCVCLGKHTYLENDRYVCMYVCTYVWGNIHTIHTWKIIGLYVCLGKHTYLETTGMYVCQRYVCVSGETYIPRKL